MSIIKGRKLTEVKTEQIKKQFELETGVSQSEIMELIEAFPFSYSGTIQTNFRTFNFWFTYGGRAKRGSFTEEK